MDAGNHVNRRSPMRQLFRHVLAATLPRRRYLVSGPADSRSVCLTFDDGPHPEHTPRLLDVLRKLEVRASFFVVGREAEHYPDLVRRLADEGHVVGHHSYHHAAPAATSASQLLKEVRQTRDILTRLLGRTSDFFRPPQGKLTLAKLWKLWRAAQTLVLWNVDPRDYARNSPGELR